MIDSPKDLYLSILSGERDRFPRGFFQDDSDFAASREIVRFFVEEIKGYKTREAILKNIRKEDFEKNKLGGLLVLKYRNSPSSAAMDAFPELEMKPWEFHETQNSYWKGEGSERRAIEAVRYVYLTRLGLKEDEVSKNLTYQVIEREGLLGAISGVFNNSLKECAAKCFPGLYPPWEVGLQVPNKYWTKENGINALRWLFEVKLQLSRDEIVKSYTRDFMIKHSLYGMVQRCFNSNLYSAINSAYPGEYKPWEFTRVPPDYWNDETTKDALTWLVEERLGITWEEAASLQKKDLVKNGLYGVAALYKGKTVGEMIGELELI